MALPEYDLYIFDLDGTLYRGEEAIEGAAAAVARLRAEGKKVRFLTNNSSLTRDSYVGKLNRLGFEVGPTEIYSSATGAATLLRRDGVQTVFVIGEPGLVETMGQAGLQTSEPGGPVDAVLVGLCRSFTYGMLDRGLQYLLQGARFYATNMDATFPVESGVVPGAGSIVAAVRTAAGREPVVIGKPEPLLVRQILEESGVEPPRALVVGDRYETDILAGRNAGCDTLLVLTGVTQTPPDGQSWMASVADLRS